MSTFIANASVYRTAGHAPDALGDDVDSPIVIPDPVPEGAAWPASIIEKSRKVLTPETGELRTARWVVGRLSAVHTVAQGDRLTDLMSGRVYVVDEVTPGRRSLAGTRDTLLDLRELDGA